MIRAASIQFQHKPGGKEDNLGRIEEFCARAATRKVQLICFPEMCITGYWHVRNLSREEISKLAEPVPGGPGAEAIQLLARKYDLVLGAGLVEQDGEGRLFNTYVVSDKGNAIHKHRKIHCFISQHMESGSAYTVFDSSLGCRLGILTCYDNNLVENARATALMGADILLAPHQTGGVRSKSPHAMGPIDPELWHNRGTNPEAIEEEFKGPKGRGWLMRWLPSRAHDNGMFLLFSNGVGLDGDEVRTGNAMILDCYGRIMAETWKARGEMVVADLDLALLENCTGRRWMRGRKPHLYRRLTEQTGAEIDARKARFS